MRAVSDNREDVLEHVGVVGLVEALCRRVIPGHVLQHLIQDAQPRVRHVPHRVLERPDHRVENQLKLLRRDRQERCQPLQHTHTSPVS